MWKLNADVFYWVSAALQRLETSAKVLAEKQHLDLKKIIPEENQLATLRNVRSLNQELGILGAGMTMASVDRFMARLSENKCTYREMIDFTNDIDMRLRDELSQVNVYVLDERKIKIPHDRIRPFWTGCRGQVSAFDS